MEGRYGKGSPTVQRFLGIYIQRDLEDQIEEEYRAQGKMYKRTNSDNMSTQEAPQIVLQDVLKLLKQGYTRLDKDDLGYGSIQSKYSLSVAEVKELFTNPKLRMKKTVIPKRSLNIVDRDIEALEEEGAVVRAGVDFTLPTDTIEGLPSEQDVVLANSRLTNREELFS